MSGRPEQPRRIVLDVGTGRVGEVTVETRARPGGPVTSVWMRPVGGGYEWRAEPRNVRPVEQGGR